MAALRSPRDSHSLNTPKMLTTPSLKDDMLSTPTLTTPRTADWGLFSPVRMTAGTGSPSAGPDREDRDPPSDLPLDSSIGLSSPHDGILAKRRKLKQQSSSAKSIESDSNSCDTPDSIPKDLSNYQHSDRQDDNRPTDLSTTKRSKPPFSPGQLGPPADLDFVRDRVGAVNISSSPKWFKHPRSCDPRLQYSKDDFAAHYPSPLAVPSPNWSKINDIMAEGLALKTPKVLDNFVFDVLPPNTPNTPKVRDGSDESIYDRHFDRPRTNGTGVRVTFANQPRPVSLTPPPPYPQDLSLRSSKPEEIRKSDEYLANHLRHKSMEMTMQARQQRGSDGMIVPKQEVEECMRASSASPSLRADSASPLINGSSPVTNGLSPLGSGEIKEEPREYSHIPPGFPPYYLHPGITPGHLYGRGGPTAERPAESEPPRHQPSPPASPPPSLHPPPSPLHPFYQQQRGFYNNFGMRHPAMIYEQHQGPNNYLWNQSSLHQTSWGPETGHNSGVYRPGIMPIKSESRHSTESPDLKGKQRRSQDEEEGEDGGPPKKRGKGKGKGAGKDPGGPKRVFVCPHCQRSYDWNYNLNRHLKYECGKENSFMCSKCGRRFPHKQNCVYHLKRKHKIMCDTVDQYVSSGLVVYQGPEGSKAEAMGMLSPAGGDSTYSGGGADTSAAYSPQSNQEMCPVNVPP